MKKAKKYYGVINLNDNDEPNANGDKYLPMKPVFQKGVIFPEYPEPKVIEVVEPIEDEYKPVLWNLSPKSMIGHLCISHTVHKKPSFDFPDTPEQKQAVEEIQTKYPWVKKNEN